MVGVPGKYKGCETCRRRRVKCSNERPFCQNCIKAGKQCEGYERERVFITGTPAGKGRVASHPKRVTPPKKLKVTKIKTEETDRRDSVIQLPPLTSAWDEQLELLNGTETSSTFLTALHTGLDTVQRSNISDDGKTFGISLEPYSPPDLSPTVMDNGLWNVSPGASWGIASEGMVKGLGPSNFTSFPNHHFFVRVYRPMAVSVALLTRRDTFISGPDWLTVPWQNHPKSQLDTLFDIVLMLPALFHQSDLLIMQQATTDRRYKAQGLLQRCLLLEAQFHQWQQDSITPRPYWSEPSLSIGASIPFENSFIFKDELSALTMLYFWMSQLLFHRCLEALYDTMCQPAFDGYRQEWTDSPIGLQMDITRFQDGRILADNICRALDSALTLTAQPDMLVAPMTVALDYYHLLNATSQTATLETLWLDAFKSRLMAKGQHVANVLQGQRWINLASY